MGESDDVYNDFVNEMPKIDSCPAQVWMIKYYY